MANQVSEWSGQFLQRYGIKRQPIGVSIQDDGDWVVFGNEFREALDAAAEEVAKVSHSISEEDCYAEDDFVKRVLDKLGR